MAVGSVTPSGQLMRQTKPLFLLCRRQTAADYDSDSEASKSSGQLLRVKVNKQKVREKLVEVNVTPRDRRTALNLVPLLPGGGTNDPAFQPFRAGVSWERMRTLLGRLVGKHSQLWAEADAIGSRLGSHEFRRLAMDSIESADPTKKDALVRGLGADRNMLDKVYHDPKKDSYERTRTVLENYKSLGVGPYAAAVAAPARAPARAPAGASARAPARAPATATATSTRAQPGVNKGVVVSRSREEAIAQAALDLEFAREENELRAREQGRK